MNRSVNCKFRMRRTANKDKNKKQEREERDGKSNTIYMKLNWTEQLTNNDEEWKKSYYVLNAHQQKSTTVFQEWAQKRNYTFIENYKFRIFIFTISVFGIQFYVSVLLLFLLFLLLLPISIFLFRFTFGSFQIMALHSSVYAPIDFQCFLVISSFLPFFF